MDDSDEWICSKIGEQACVVVTATDLIKVFFKYRPLLKAVGSGNGIVNSTYMLRSMLVELGFKPEDIRKSMGDAGLVLDKR